MTSNGRKGTTLLNYSNNMLICIDTKIPCLFQIHTVAQKLEENLSIRCAQIETEK